MMVMAYSQTQERLQHIVFLGNFTSAPFQKIQKCCINVIIGVVYDPHICSLAQKQIIEKTVCRKADRLKGKVTEKLH